MGSDPWDSDSVLPPDGAPVAYVNGEPHLRGSIILADLAEIEFRTGFAGGSIFYTIDGKDALSYGDVYFTPFSVSQDVELNAVAFSADYTKQTMIAEKVMVKVSASYVVTLTTPGAGTVSIEPEQDRYLDGTQVTISAEADENWEFLGWRGDTDSKEAQVTLTVDSGLSIEGLFGTKITTFKLGQGDVLINPSLERYVYGSTVQLMAVPNDGYYLKNWAQAATGDVSPMEYKVEAANPTVMAIFIPATGKATLTLLVDGPGKVEVEPQKAVYSIGETVALKAVPNSSAKFVGYSG